MAGDKYFHTRWAVRPGQVAKKPASIAVIQVLGTGFHIATDEKFTISSFFYSYTEFDYKLDNFEILPEADPSRLKYHIPSDGERSLDIINSLLALLLYTFNVTFVRITVISVSHN